MFSVFLIVPHIISNGKGKYTPLDVDDNDGNNNINNNEKRFQSQQDSEKEFVLIHEWAPRLAMKRSKFRPFGATTSENTTFGRFLVCQC